MSTTPCSLVMERTGNLNMERTGQWVLSQDIPSDIIVEVGESTFSLHKFMLVAKSNYIRKLILESKESELGRIDLSNIPGGVEAFEKVVKFCYGVHFEITVHNVAALRCAAEYLQMTDEFCEYNLANRTEEFLSQVAFTTLSAGAIIVLKTCQYLLPMATQLNIVQRSVDVIVAKACIEATFPSRTPANWWTHELAILDITSFQRVITSMKTRGAKTLIIASAIITYSERFMRDLVRDHSGNGIKSSSDPENPELITQHRELLESILVLLPCEKDAFPINFLCSLLRCAILLKSSASSKNELEMRLSGILENVTVGDLLVLSFTYDGESLFDLESVRKVISGFVAKENSMVDVFNGGNFREVCSLSMQRVAKTVDTYLGEIANCEALSISKFNGIANLLPKDARRYDDDLYRAIGIYLKSHPNLDEVEKEKVYSAMDPLKLSYEARVHASQNKRLPIQTVLHALYYDQLKLRSGESDHGTSLPEDVTKTSRVQLQLQTTDDSLAKENETLRLELMKMKMYISDLQKTTNNNSNATTSRSGMPKKTFFSTMSKTLGKLNPFKHGPKDTSRLGDDVDLTKPRRRRFSMS